MRGDEQKKQDKGKNYFCGVVCYQVLLQCLINIIAVIHLSQYNMVFSGEEGFKGGASAPSLEREVSGMSFSAATA